MFDIVKGTYKNINMIPMFIANAHMLKYGLAFCEYVENKEFANIMFKFSDFLGNMQVYDSYTIDSWHFFKFLPRIIYITHDSQITDNIIN